MTEIKKRKQMAFDILPEVHHQIKILAATRNISINTWMARAIRDRIAKEMRIVENKDKE